MWSHPCHARVFDADLFLSLGKFLSQPVNLRLPSHPSIQAIERPTAGVNRGILGQRNDVQHGRT